jgi:phosphoglycolate phosphatase
MKRLILWDVDGTLLLAGGAGRHALEVAVRSVVRGLDAVPEVRVGGLTDQRILTLIMEKAGVDRIETRLPTAIRIAEREIAKSLDWIRRDGTCLPGVIPVVERLHGMKGVRQTLLTGNLVKNAETKMRAFGLERLIDLDVGAYGTDHIDREELVQFALRRARELRGETYDAGEVWVIGDTEHDLACARAGNVRCMLVGTSSKRGRLQHLGADAYFDDLTDTDAVVEVLVG